MERGISKVAGKLKEFVIMKKLLVLVLVLGMASMASAALQISVNGIQEPVDSEITLDAPSGTAMLDIWTDSMIYASAQGEGDWFLMCDNNLGTISGGAANAALQATGNVLAIYDGKEAGAWVIESPFDGVGGGVVALGAPMMAGDVLYDQILFHCEKLGDIVRDSLPKIPDKDLKNKFKLIEKWAYE